MYLHTLRFANIRFVSFLFIIPFEKPRKKTERTNAFLTFFVLHEAFNLKEF